jgi:radical SAM protein with 4Fe4S-binding SPASM domain
VYDVAALSLSHGGWCKPNILRELPHKGLDFSDLRISQEDCLDALKAMNRRLIETFGLDVMSRIGARFRGPEVCSVTSPNSHFICGMGHSLIDLDWNGDVYPCHLNKSSSLILGNLYSEEFDVIFRRVRENNIRVTADNIPKCSACKFVSTCGGGCRAGAWYAYGSLAREDSHCDLNYNSQLRKLLISAGSH